MDNKLCNIKVITNDQRIFCLIKGNLNDTVKDIKLQIQQQYLRNVSSFRLLYNKIYLMDDTKIGIFHPSTDTFSLVMEYGVDYDCTFVFDDGEKRRARINSFETFEEIKNIGLSVYNNHTDRYTIICDDFIPVPQATPSSYNYNRHHFRIVKLPMQISDSYLPNIQQTLKIIDRTNDLLMCYNALIYFFKQQADYVALTDLGLITCNCFSNLNNYIPSTFDYLLIELINEMIYKRIGISTFQSSQLNRRDSRVIFLEILYNCLHVLVMRYLMMHVPIISEAIDCLLLPIQIAQDIGSSGIRMSMRVNHMNTKISSACSELMSICISTLDLYCNADDIDICPPREEIVHTLRQISRKNVSTTIYAKILSCLCGQCRIESCMKVIIDAFPLDTVTSLINDCEGVPEIIRTLFLIYAFIMERTNMTETERDQILEKATEYLDRHGDNLPLLEAYILLVIPAYNGNFSSLSRRVAVKLEEALQFSEQSDVIDRWINTLLSSYFHNLSEDAYDYYVQQSTCIFIALHDNVLDEKVVKQCVQSLQVYCMNPYLKSRIITIDSMDILVTLLKINMEANSKVVLQITSLLLSVLDNNPTGIDYFLDNHALDYITERMQYCNHVETISALYDLMIIVFKEVSPDQLPSFSIDVFDTISRLNENNRIIEKGMTILSLFNKLRTDNVKDELNKLNTYIMSAMSLHNYYLISIIIYILSILDMDDDAIRHLESIGFFKNIYAYITEFANKQEDNGELIKNNEHFTNIVYYMLGFFHDHIENNYLVSLIDLRIILPWVECYKYDLGIVSTFVELLVEYIESSYSKANEQTEIQTVRLLLDLIPLYTDQTLACYTLQNKVLVFLLTRFNGYHDIISSAFTQISFRSTLISLLYTIFNYYGLLIHVNAEATVQTPKLRPTINLSCLPKSNQQFTKSVVYCINVTSKQTKPKERRHCLSHSLQQATTMTKQGRPLIDTSRTLTEEERLYDWMSLLINILQLIQGIMKYNEIDLNIYLAPFKEPLSYHYGLFRYISENKKKDFKIVSIMSMIKEILEEAFNIQLIEEEIDNHGAPFSNISETTQSSEMKEKQRTSNGRFSLGLGKTAMLRVSAVEHV